MPLAYKDLAAPLAEPVTLSQAKKQLVREDSFVDDDGYITGLIAGARKHVEKLMQRAIFPRPMQLNLDFFPYPDYDSTVNPNDRRCLYGTIWHQLAIRLPRPAALSVESIRYIDLSGNWQVVDPLTYYLDATSEPARIVPKPGLYWPYSQSWLPGSVEVKYTAGSYVETRTEEVLVPADPGPYDLPLTSANLGIVSLVDASGNPVSAPRASSVAVAASYAGEQLTATYYSPNCPETVSQAMLLLISHWYNHRDAAESQPPKEIEFGVNNLLAGEAFETFGF